MNWRKTAATATLALVVLLGMTGCPLKPPATPGAPWGAESTYTGAVYRCSVTTTVPKGEFRYVINWTDASETTASDSAYESGDTTALRHAWDSAGTYDVSVQAILDANPAKASGWSPTKSVRVIPNLAPIVDSVHAPPVAVFKAEARFIVYGYDPEEDSMRVVVDWGRGSPTDTGYFLSPCEARISHVFATVGTDTALFYLEDWKGTRSAPCPVEVKVGKEGGVDWAWVNDDLNRGPLTTSALVVNNGSVEVVMGCCSEDGKFYSIKASSGTSAANASPKDIVEGAFISHPAAANGHAIVASDEYELYALSLSNLDNPWQYPDSASGKAPPFEFGTAAINGADIYLSYDDTTIAHFQDLGAAVIPQPTYTLHASLVDAPVVDASGNVIFGTDSGYLVKMDGNLSSPIWRTHLLPVGDINGPIIGNDGTIYCGCDDSCLFAVSPDSGVLLWTARLDAVGARPALGQSALFVGSEYGTIYSINPVTGLINWKKSLSPGIAFSTTPIVAANGYVYFQSEEDILYCVNQADGAIIWECDCRAFLEVVPGGRAGSSHRPRRLQANEFPPNPSITSTGDIIVVGSDALYCVTGYESGTLDATAPWPKWQKDLSNTGKK